MSGRSADAQLAPGTLLAGKYRISGVLGSGGMGTVYAATHEVLNARVAVKVRRDSSGARDPKAAARILNEARALGALASEHVARVTDAGVLDSGDPFVVIEYLEGEDLAAVLARDGRLRVTDAVDYALQALEGLAEAHGQSIIHRDIKPSNLFLARVRRRKPIVKLLDFGISKFEGSSPIPVDAITTGATTVGTPAYMSPEQIRSPKRIDARSDIWSMGVVLYELVAGTRPFVADTFGELFALILEQRPRPLTEIVPECSAALSDAVARCLMVSADARFANVAELAAALVGEVTDGEARVERIKAALDTSATMRAATAAQAAAEGRSAPTRTLRVDVSPPRAAANVAETRSAWGGSPRAPSPTSRAARVRRRIVHGTVILSSAAALAFFAVALSRSTRDDTVGAAVATPVVASAPPPVNSAVDSPLPPTSGPTSDLAPPPSAARVTLNVPTRRAHASAAPASSAPPAVPPPPPPLVPAPPPPAAAASSLPDGDDVRNLDLRVRH